MEILTTTNYEQFKKLKGNRPVEEPHVLQIIDKVKNEGQSFTVITVNSNMEVADGQHRLEAFKRLGLPVHYIVSPYASFKDCIMMNATQSPWSLNDYISGHADLGNANYIALKEMLDKYGDLGISVVTAVISRKVNGVARTKKTSQKLKTGEFVFPFEAKDELEKEFDFLMGSRFIRKCKGHGRNDIFFNALATCYECPFINNDRLLERMSQNTDKFGAYNTFRECLERVQDVYNLYARQKVYLAHDVQLMLDEAKKSAKEVK